VRQKCVCTLKQLLLTGNSTRRHGAEQTILARLNKIALWRTTPPARPMAEPIPARLIIALSQLQTAPRTRIIASRLELRRTVPLPTKRWHITNAPQRSWVWPAANLRLQKQFPCINSGNNAYARGGSMLMAMPVFWRAPSIIGGVRVFKALPPCISYAWLLHTVWLPMVRLTMLTSMERHEQLAGMACRHRPDQRPFRPACA